MVYSLLSMVAVSIMDGHRRSTENYGLSANLTSLWSCGVVELLSWGVGDLLSCIVVT